MDNTSSLCISGMKNYSGDRPPNLNFFNCYKKASVSLAVGLATLNICTVLLYFVYQIAIQNNNKFNDI